MAVEGFNYIVETSWAPTDGKDAADVISVGSSCDPNEQSDEFEGEIRHEINEENLIHLVQPDHDDAPCTVTIKILEPDWTITKLSLVSEARTVELYGLHGEYISTSRGVALGQTSNVSLYNSQPDISVRHELTIKFPGAKESIWIYGVKLLVKKLDDLPTGTVDYNRVDEMLKSSQYPLTDKAEQAKKFLEKYSSLLGGTQQKQSDPMTIMRMLETEYKSHLKPGEDAGRNVSQYLESFMQAKQKRETDDGLGEMKAYVDQSMQQLEERVQNNLKLQLEAMEEKQNEKLDTILQLLAHKA